MTTEERLEEVSEQGSELIETDSSCAEGDHEINVGEMSPVDQGADIVAGSPTKHTRTDHEDDQSFEEPKTPDVPMAREEMNGVIIYDSYAKLTGCEKIVQYFEERTY